MRRIASGLSVLFIALAAACSTDRSTGAPLPLSSADVRPRANGTTSTACPNLTPQEVTDLIFEVFETGSPDANSARGKWDNIQLQAANGNTAEVENKAYNLIDFMLDKQRDGKLATSPEVAARFSLLLKAIACFANIDFEYPVGATGDYLDPSDPDRIIRTRDNQAAAFVPAGAVNSRSFLVIDQIEETLRTTLDKYPRNYDFALYPNVGFNQKITLGICATAPDIGTLSRLLLGHNIGNTGFELLEPRNVDFLNLTCQAAPSVAQNTVFERMLSALLPKKLYAAAFFGVGGVGGAASELSPFGPVDPRIRVTKNAAGESAPIGGGISPAPSVSYATPTGVVLGGISTAFTTTSGEILPSSVISDGAGLAAAASWTLGETPGAVTATATPQIGGAVAVPNAYFIDANYEVLTSVTFNATATAPARVVVTQAPTALTGNTFPAGVVHTPPTMVEVRDDLGRVVPAFNGIVTMQATAGAVGQTIIGTPNRSAAAGMVTFNDLAITKTGTYMLTPSASYAGAALPVTGAYSVNIIPAAGIITRAMPLILDTVTTITQTPRVRVADAYGNPLTGQTVYWQAFGSTAPATSIIDADGLSSVTWTLQEGLNSLLAALDTPASAVAGRSVDFSTFYKTRQSSALQSCAVNQNRADLLSHGFRFTALPGGNNNPARLDSLKFYFSVTGAASEPRVNRLRLIATQTGGGLLQPKVDTFLGEVLLKGNASQDAPGLFRLGGFTPVAGATLSLRIERAEAAVQGTLRFNTGSCNNTRLQRYLLAGGSVPNPASVAYQLFGR
jgi:hypothetical protein